MIKLTKEILQSQGVSFKQNKDDFHVSLYEYECYKGLHRFLLMHNKNIIVKTQSYCIFTAMKEVVLRYKEIQETKKIPTPKEIIKMERAI